MSWMIHLIGHPTLSKKAWSKVAKREVITSKRWNLVRKYIPYLWIKRGNKSLCREIGDSKNNKGMIKLRIDVKKKEASMSKDKTIGTSFKIELKRKNLEADQASLILMNHDRHHIRDHILKQNHQLLMNQIIALR